MSTISAFKAQLQGGGARPNQFRVELNFPAFIGSAGAAAGNAAQFLCIASSLPSSNVTDITTAYRGRPVYLAGERTFQPWGISVLNDTNFLIRNALEKWSNGIANYTTTNGILRPSDYQVDLSVYQLDRNDNVLKAYKFFDAFPTSVGGINLSYSANNEIETYEVTFAFNYFTASKL